MTSRILIPIELPEPEKISKEVVKALSSLDIVLMGYYNVPEQTTPEQAKKQFEEECQKALNEIAHQFENEEAIVSKKLIFTHNKQDSLQRIAEEENCDAVLAFRISREMKSILVAIKDARIIDKITNFIADLVETVIEQVTLIHISSSDKEANDFGLMLKGVKSILVKKGVDSNKIKIKSVVSKNIVEKIIDESHNHDAIIVGETNPSIEEIFLGEISEKISDRSDRPVMIVRRENVEK